LEEEEININEVDNDSKIESFLKQFIDGSILTKQIISKHLLYILFLVGLSMVYIYNKYKTDDIVIKISKTHKEIKKLRSKSVINASELMIIRRESEVKKMAKKKNLELEELKEPAIEIKYSK